MNHSFSMKKRKYLSPDDFALPEGFRKVTESEMYDMEQLHELYPLMRFFAKQVHDTGRSVFVKGADTKEDKLFLNKCRRDSKKFREALRSALERALMSLDLSSHARALMAGTLISNSERPEYDKFFHFSVEIRPLYFSSSLSDEEKAIAKRYPKSEKGKYTVFLHLDSNYKFQMQRFALPDNLHPVLSSSFEAYLKVFEESEFHKLLETQYGDWETLSDYIISSFLKKAKEEKTW